MLQCCNVAKVENLRSRGRLNIVIRVDSSEFIGVGHVMRCITLAEKFKTNKRNIKIIFICRNYIGNSIDFILKKGYECLVLKDFKNKEDYKNVDNFYDNWISKTWKQDVNETIKLISDIKVDLIVIDHYGIDFQWEVEISKFVNKIMIIDDLANRKHNADVLLDQNYYENSNDRYSDLVPTNCIQFTGLRYLLLRDEFEKITHSKFQKSCHVKKLLVFFGGNDNSGLTIKVLKSLLGISFLKFKVDIVIGERNLDLEEIKILVNTNINFNLYIQTEHMALLMSEADFAIISGGSVIWEACSIGLPIFVVVTAENQEEVVSFLDKSGVIKSIGRHDKINHRSIELLIKFVQHNPNFITKLSCKSKDFLSNCCSGVDQLVNEVLQ